RNSAELDGTFGQAVPVAVDDGLGTLALPRAEGDEQGREVLGARMRQLRGGCLELEVEQAVDVAGCEGRRTPVVELGRPRGRMTGRTVDLAHGDQVVGEEAAADDQHARFA